MLLVVAAPVPAVLLVSVQWRMTTVCAVQVVWCGSICTWCLCGDVCGHEVVCFDGVGGCVVCHCDDVGVVVLCVVMVWMVVLHCDGV